MDQVNAQDINAQISAVTIYTVYASKAFISNVPMQSIMFTKRFSSVWSSGKRRYMLIPCKEPSIGTLTSLDVINCRFPLDNSQVRLRKLEALSHNDAHWTCKNNCTSCYQNLSRPIARGHTNGIQV
eukprot:1153271-Pelagomonas_calceolata.AAC.2